MIRTRVAMVPATILTLLLVTSPLVAQISPMTVRFNRSYGGPGGETGNAIVPLQRGGYLLAGYSTVDGIDHEFLVRVDSAGDTLWTRTSSDSTEDPAWDAVADSDGTITVLGYTTGHGSTGEDALVTRLDQTGKLLWRRTIGGPGDQLAWSMTPLSGGDYAVAGQIRSTPAEAWSGWIARIGPAGELRWSHTLTRGAEARLFGVTAGPRGGAIFVGTRRTETGIRHGSIIAVDAAGTVEWEHELGNDHWQVAHQVLTEPDGTLLVTGYGEALDTAAPSATIAGPRREQAILSRWSAQGDSLWAVRGNGSSDERTIASAPMTGGGFLSIGYRRVRGEEDWDILLIATDTSGHQLWTRTFGGPLPDRGVNLLPLRDGSVLLTGSSNQGPGHGNDLILIKLGPASQ